ncbi:hypothetical protein BCR32DRAFT_274699 [Anaeromyces robustus]|uniref:Uncharacterized protein n=1 Tax=Anaeromyces robustus TaxID=1754192 RepID=A0A1Y1XNZ0_9FUNG|nr:hypothetical protein BCR32DRAFT_274699 [Anaeromyces robustus]|eukprot:ORX87236.1 hypothetical protein BCR32DRAFT_274699 [Anaeromyces robustus]
MKFFHLLFFVVIICTLQWETQHNFVNAAKTPENIYFPHNNGYSNFYNTKTKKTQSFKLCEHDLLFSYKIYSLERCRYNPANVAIYCEFTDNYSYPDTSKFKYYRVKFFVDPNSVTCKFTENNFTKVESDDEEFGYVPPLHKLTGTEGYRKTIKLHLKNCSFNAKIYKFYVAVDMVYNSKIAFKSGKVSKECLSYCPCCQQKYEKYYQPIKYISIPSWVELQLWKSCTSIKGERKHLIEHLYKSSKELPVPYFVGIGGLFNKNSNSHMQLFGVVI